MVSRKDSAEEYDTDDGIEYEEDQGAAQVKKLREKLKRCEEEKKEYLDGWQRLQADVANIRRKEGEKTARERERAQQDVVRDILPVLDSFESALSGDAWERVDDVWKKGVENIHTQLLDVLRAHGITAFGEAGESFDPAVYEAVAHEPTTDEAQADTVARVERRGYRSDESVLRPAQVAVYKTE